MPFATNDGEFPGLRAQIPANAPWLTQTATGRVGYGPITSAPPTAPFGAEDAALYGMGDEPESAFQTLLQRRSILSEPSEHNVQIVQPPAPAPVTVTKPTPAPAPPAPAPGTINRTALLPLDLLRNRRKLIYIPIPKNPQAVYPTGRYAANIPYPGGFGPPGMTSQWGGRSVSEPYAQLRRALLTHFKTNNYRDPRIQRLEAVPRTWPKKQGLSVDQVMEFLKIMSRGYYGNQPVPGDSGFLKKYGEQKVRTLLDIWWNPTLPELADLQLIDYVLPEPWPAIDRRRGMTPPAGITLRRGQSYHPLAYAFAKYPAAQSSILGSFYSAGGVETGYTPDDLLICKKEEPPPPKVGVSWRWREQQTTFTPSPAASQPFFCPPAPKPTGKSKLLFPFPSVLARAPQQPYGIAARGRNPRISYWGLDLSKPWEEVKPILVRALIAEKALLDYPWPSPGVAFASYWIRLQSADFKKFVMNGPMKSWNDVRAWLAMSILSKYNTVIAMYNHDMKKKAKKKKRTAIIRAVASAALGIVFAAFAPAVIAATFTAVKTALDVKTKVDAAKDMAKAGKQFARTDKAFAAELERVSAELDKSAAEEAKAAGMTTEEAEAEAEAFMEESIEEKGVIVVVEGKKAGTTATAEEAAKLAEKTAQPGERFEFYAAGKGTGLFLRTHDGFQKVPPEAEGQIRALPPEDLKRVVDAMPRKTKIPWAPIAAGGAAAVLFIL